MKNLIKEIATLEIEFNKGNHEKTIKNISNLVIKNILRDLNQDFSEKNVKFVKEEVIKEIDQYFGSNEKTEILPIEILTKNGLKFVNQKNYLRCIDNELSRIIELNNACRKAINQNPYMDTEWIKDFSNRLTLRVKIKFDYNI